jgi:hypothetical protein
LASISCRRRGPFRNVTATQCLFGRSTEQAIPDDYDKERRAIVARLISYADDPPVYPEAVLNIVQLCRSFQSLAPDPGCLDGQVRLCGLFLVRAANRAILPVLWRAPKMAVRTIMPVNTGVHCACSPAKPMPGVM